MVTRFTSRPRAGMLLLSAIFVLSAGAACDKVPLLAPTGTVITLFISSSTVPADGAVEIIATLIEESGTAVQNGTLVKFTTTIGRIAPSEARTNNGQVTVRFFSDGQNGTATITAYSGGASEKIEGILLGAAAAKRITVTASPQSLPAAGGISVIRARLETELGGGIPGVPVTFTTTAGTLSSSIALTDEFGIATTTLTTDRQADVTAVSGAQTGRITVGLSPRLIATFTASPQAASAGTPITFTVSSGTGANIQDAVINFGDGTQHALGSFSGSVNVSHAYDAPGSYTPSVTARDALGGSQTQTTGVTIGSLPVTLSASSSTPAPNQPVTFTVSGVGNAQVSRYQWTFSDPKIGTFSTTGPQTTQSFDTRGQKTVRVEVIGVNGGVLGTAETRITVQGL